MKLVFLSVMEHFSFNIIKNCSSADKDFFVSFFPYMNPNINRTQWLHHKHMCGMHARPMRRDNECVHALSRTVLWKANHPTSNSFQRARVDKRETPAQQQASTNSTEPTRIHFARTTGSMKMGTMWRRLFQLRTTNYNTTHCQTSYPAE